MRRFLVIATLLAAGMARAQSPLPAVLMGLNAQQAWTPLQLTNLCCWLDYTQTSTLTLEAGATLTNNARIVTWDSAYAAVDSYFNQTTSGSRPQYNSTLGISFDGTAQWSKGGGTGDGDLQALVEGNDKPWSALAVVNLTDATVTLRTILGFGMGGTTYYHYWYTYGNIQYMHRRRASTGDQVAVGDTSTNIANNVKILAHVYSGTSIKFYNNGTLTTNATANTADMGANLDRWAIGVLHRNTQSAYFKGYIRELIFTKDAISDENRGKVETYWRTKYGL